MLTLANFARQLKITECSQLFLGSDADLRGYTAENWEKLILGTNEGLTALHSRFILLRKELLLDCYEAIATYELRPDRAMSATGTQRKYIWDTPTNPFYGGVLKVLQVVNEVGYPMPLNDDGDPASVFTPEFDKIQIPFPENGKAFSVLYQGNHKEVGLDADPIVIPPALRKALNCYVASCLYSAIPGEATMAKGAELMQKYNDICAEVEAKDLGNTSQVETNYKLEMRGFV